MSESQLSSDGRVGPHCEWTASSFQFTYSPSSLPKVIEGRELATGFRGSLVKLLYPRSTNNTHKRVVACLGGTRSM